MDRGNRPWRLAAGTKFSRSAVGLISLAASLVVSLVLGVSVGSSSVQTPTIHVLSNRADLISGGDALVSIDVPPRVNTNGIRVSLNGQGITRFFALRPNGRFEGLVAGLINGPNTLEARLPNGTRQQLTITNHPNGGPVIAGPQLQPWVCQSTAVDGHCNQPPSYAYVYESTDPTKQGLQAYDPNNPPSDVAQTTTDQGVSVPFIVRIETG